MMHLLAATLFLICLVERCVGKIYYVDNLADFKACLPSETCELPEKYSGVFLHSCLSYSQIIDFPKEFPQVKHFQFADGFFFAIFIHPSRSEGKFSTEPIRQVLLQQEQFVAPKAPADEPATLTLENCCKSQNIFGKHSNFIRPYSEADYYNLLNSFEKEIPNFEEAILTICINLCVNLSFQLYENVQVKRSVIEKISLSEVQDILKRKISSRCYKDILKNVAVQLNREYSDIKDDAQIILNNYFHKHGARELLGVKSKDVCETAIKEYNIIVDLTARCKTIWEEYKEKSSYYIQSNMMSCEDIEILNGYEIRSEIIKKFNEFNSIYALTFAFNFMFHYVGEYLWREFNVLSFEVSVNNCSQGWEEFKSNFTSYYTSNSIEALQEEFIKMIRLLFSTMLIAEEASLSEIKSEEIEDAFIMYSDMSNFFSFSDFYQIITKENTNHPIFPHYSLICRILNAFYMNVIVCLKIEHERRGELKKAQQVGS